MRRGYSLLETLLSLVIAGILLGITLPRFGDFRDRLAVTEEAVRIAAAHRRARVMAILQSRPVVLTVNPDSLIITAEPDSKPQWAQEGPAAHGVALAGGVRRISFSPVGITTGVSNATFNLTRGAASRAVVVSRLGRLRIR